MPKRICVSNIVFVGKVCFLPTPSDEFAIQEMLMLAGLNYISRGLGDSDRLHCRHGDQV